MIHNSVKMKGRRRTKLFVSF